VDTDTRPAMSLEDLRLRGTLTAITALAPTTERLVIVTSLRTRSKRARMAVTTLDGAAAVPRATGTPAAAAAATTVATPAVATDSAATVTTARPAVETTAAETPVDSPATQAIIPAADTTPAATIVTSRPTAAAAIRPAEIVTTPSRAPRLRMAETTLASAVATAAAATDSAETTTTPAPAAVMDSSATLALVIAAVFLVVMADPTIARHLRTRPAVTERRNPRHCSIVG